MGASVGSGGSNGPPPTSVDETCRAWCVNELGGRSCHQGTFESMEPCYEGCLETHAQNEDGAAVLSNGTIITDTGCGNEWIAIKDCELDLNCEDAFGDCDAVEDQYYECLQTAFNRAYCQHNCPELNPDECAQDMTECGMTPDAGGRGGNVPSTLERLTLPVPDSAPPSFASEATDQVQSAELLATGEVVGACVEGSCTGDDPVDQLVLTPGRRGTFKISLTWPDSPGSDLDLFVLDSEGMQLGISAQQGTVPESISRELADGQPYVVQVQAFGTSGFVQGYTLGITAR